MLDADSVFERLLKEASNMVPKMSTPKLTAALKVSSTLQQRITDTLSSRLQQEQSVVTAMSAKNFNVQGVQSIISAPVISDEIVSDHSFLTSDEAFSNRSAISPNYAAIPFFPQFNQFAISQRSATLVTITSPHGSASTGAVMGTLGPTAHPTPIAPAPNAQSVIIPVQTASQVSDPLQTPPMTTSKHDGLCDPCSILITTTTNSTPVASSCDPNGRILTSTCLECVDIKPDPVTCLSQVGTKEPSTIFTASSTTASVTGGFGTSTDTLNFFPVTTAVSTESPSSISSTTATMSADNLIIPVAITAPVTTTATAVATPTTVMMIKAISGNEADGGGGAVGSGPYQCMHCGKEFRVLRYLEKHKRIHTGEKPYQCCFCGRLFNDWPNMNRHKRIHTGERPYRCSVCTKTFSQPAVYNEHVKRHTGERPYVCTVCSKGFPRAARLAVHMRVHTGEKPYRCHVCDRRFSQPHHLSTHIRIHSGDRSFRFAVREGTAEVSANSRRHRRQVVNHSTSDFISPAVAISDTPPGTLVKPLNDGGAIQTSSPASIRDQAKVCTVETGGSTQNEESSGVCSGDSALHPESGESLLSQDGELQVSKSSSTETSGEVGRAKGMSINTSTSFLAPSITVVSSTGNVEHAPSSTSNAATAGLTVSDGFCSQPPPSIFDPNGTIYISTLDGTAAISGGVSAALVPETTTITSTLPQIHPQPRQITTAFATTTTAFPSDPHHLQPQGPIQICYSTSPTAISNAADPPTFLLSSTSKSQMFGSMLMPISTSSAHTALPSSLASIFPYVTNPPTTFQAIQTLSPQVVTTKSGNVTEKNVSLKASSITADV